VHDVLGTFVPLGLFMLIPIWIPLVGLMVGTVLDWLRPPQPSPARVAAARKRSQASTSRPKHWQPSAPPGRDQRAGDVPGSPRTL
jgi:hypothetical protein